MLSSGSLAKVCEGKMRLKHDVNWALHKWLQCDDIAAQHVMGAIAKSLRHTSIHFCRAKLSSNACLSTCSMLIIPESFSLPESCCNSPLACC